MNPNASTPDSAFVNALVKKQAICIGVAVTFVLFWTALYLQFTVDDAFISFRYGKTLIQSHAWNWNPSGHHTEAYTSFLYTLLSIIPAVLHVSFPLFFKFVGLACVGVMAYRLWTESSSRLAAILGLLLIGLNPWVWIHAYSGLETPLYMLLILETGLCIRHAQQRTPLWAYSLFLLLPLTRPEGVVFAAAAVLLYWRGRGSLTKGGRALALVLCVGAVYFLLRWHYFHSLLPNPFYVKVSGSSLHDMLSALASNISWSKGYILTLAFILLLARHNLTRIFTACSLLILLCLFAPHGMQMNYADRYWFQLTFPLLLLFLNIEEITLIPRAATMVAAVALVTITLRDLAPALHMFPQLRSAHIEMGRRLAPYAANHTLVIGDAGAVPFYSGWVTYDYLGLCTSSVAHHGVTSSDLAHFHPDLIVLYSTSATADTLNHPGPEGQAAVVAYMRQTGDYDYIAAAAEGENYLATFLRKDTPQHDEIAAALRATEQANTPFSIKNVLLQRYVPWSN